MVPNDVTTGAADGSPIRTPMRHPLSAPAESGSKQGGPGCSSMPEQVPQVAAADSEQHAQEEARHGPCPAPAQVVQAGQHSICEQHGNLRGQQVHQYIDAIGIKENGKTCEFRVADNAQNHHRGDQCDEPVRWLDLLHPMRCIAVW